MREYEDLYKKQPNSISINGIEIPSYQRFWEETSRLEGKIDRMKKIGAILAAVNLAAIILTALK